MEQQTSIMESRESNVTSKVIAQRAILQKRSSSPYINLTSSKSLRHLPKPTLKQKSRSMTSISSGVPSLKMGFDELDKTYSKAFAHLTGQHGAINPKKAFQLFVEVANQLPFHLASLYIPPQLRTNLAGEEPSEGTRAREICTDATYRVACCFHEGIGTSKNLTKAKRWYKKIAEPNYRINDLGVLKAQINLSKIYSTQVNQELKTSGKVRRSLLEKSRLHLHRASLQPSIEAHLLLGDHYQNTLDYEQALIHYCYAFNLIDDESTKLSNVQFTTKEILELHQHILKIMAAFTQDDFDKAKKKAEQYKHSVIGLNPKLSKCTWFDISL